MPRSRRILNCTLTEENDYLHEASLHYCMVLHFISERPTVSTNCSSLNTVNEGDDFSCECRGEIGNYPANVTWCKDGEQIGRTEKEKQTLTLSKVDNTASGTYICVAQGHTMFKDQKSIKLIVYCK